MLLSSTGSVVSTLLTETSSLVLLCFRNRTSRKLLGLVTRSSLLFCSYQFVRGVICFPLHDRKRVYRSASVSCSYSPWFVSQGQLQSAYQEKLPAMNAIYAHAQDFLTSDELLLAILKAFIPQPLNKQQTIFFHVF
jgi:hypothetical protein